MFTGIIESLGKVQSVSVSGKSIYVRIVLQRRIRLGRKKPAGWKIKKGESINIDGICSTVKGLRGNSFEVEYMPETIKKTTAGFFKKGAYVNLERSLRANDRLDGHLVQGHVDTTGDVREIKKMGNSVILKIGFPGRYRRFIAEKGAISVNGVSLTVVNVGRNWFTPHLSKRKGAGFSVSLVSYTLKHTNLLSIKKGDKVNLEVDMLARYLDALTKR